MAKINMRDYYPFYQDDEYVEVSDELAAEMAQWERTERSQKGRSIVIVQIILWIGEMESAGM